MTRPTEEQIKALKPGDRFLAEYEVSRPDALREGCLYADNVGEWGEDHCRVSFAAIHSILPREIKAGDRVRARGSRDQLVVVAVDGGEARVKSVDDPKSGHWTAALVDLEVIS